MQVTTVNEGKREYEVIIIGGSYAGLAAALSLARSLRQILIIDNGEPCNNQASHAHNFLSRDGDAPAAILSDARKQLMQYSTVEFKPGFAITAFQHKEGFQVKTNAEQLFNGKKLILATGLKDKMLQIRGFAECWGVSVLHCPYCHGYEAMGKPTAVISNGNLEEIIEFTKMLTQWTRDLLLFTNGSPSLTERQKKELDHYGIAFNEKSILCLDHINGKIKSIITEDGSSFSTPIVYARPEFVQHSAIPSQLGCEFIEHDLIKVDMFQQTSIHGVFACGDNSNLGRSISFAVSAGSTAGMSLNKQLTDDFLKAKEY